MEHQILDIFEMSILAKNGLMSRYADMIVLADNIGKVVDWGYYNDRQYPIPVKQQCTIVMFCKKGGFRYRVNFRDYDVGESQAILLPPNAISAILHVEDDSEIMFIAFVDSYISVTVPIGEVACLYKTLSENPVFQLSSSQFDHFYNLYKLASNDLRSEAFPYKEDVIKGYMQVFIAHLRDCIPAASRGEMSMNHRGAQIYFQFIQLVNEYHTSRRDVAFYAEKLCLSPKYLSQVILNVSGMYALDIIKEQVIAQAKALLKSRKYSVQQIAYQLHFPNPSFFGKYFRTEVGCSPREYMKGDML